MEERYKVRIAGTRPLLMHSCNAMLDEVNNKTTRKKDYDQKDDAEKALYKNKDGTIVVPSFCILSCLRESAKNFQVPGKGKKTFKNFIYAGIRLDPVEIPVITGDGYEIDLKPVVVNRSRIIRARPRFDEWALEFEIAIVDPIIRDADLKAILEDAGKYNGLLDFRPLYGLFTVETFERIREGVV